MIHPALAFELMRATGFTLIEVLAVVLIMGMISAIGLPVIVRWASIAHEQAWYAQLRTVEQSTRLAAYGCGAIVELQSTGLSERYLQSGEVKELMLAPKGIRLVWEQANGDALEYLVYDQRARCQDVVVRAFIGGRVFRSTLNGLTGKWSTLRAEETSAQ